MWRIAWGRDLRDHRPHRGRVRHIEGEHPLSGPNVGGHDLEALIREVSHAVGADKSRGAGEEQLHGQSPTASLLNVGPIVSHCAVALLPRRHFLSLWAPKRRVRSTFTRWPIAVLPPNRKTRFRAGFRSSPAVRKGPPTRLYPNS